MPKITTYLGIGSNLGDRFTNIRRSIRYLQSNPRISVKKLSHLYETSPRGGPKNQSQYLNAAVKIEISLNPFDLLQYLKTIEKKLKRRTPVRWGARTIDMDILFFNDLVLLHRDLCIPHPLLHERVFVLKPLSEIAAGVIHPLRKKSVRAMLKELHGRNKEVVTVFS